MAAIGEETSTAAHPKVAMSREALLRQRRQLLVELSVKRRKLLRNVAKVVDSDGVQEEAASDVRLGNSALAQETDRSECDASAGAAQAMNGNLDSPPAQVCDRVASVDCSSGPLDCGKCDLRAKALLKFENKVRAVKLSASAIVILTDMMTHLERENKKLFKWYTALCWDLKDVPALVESFGVCLACKSPQSRLSKEGGNLYSLEQSGVAVSPDNSMMAFAGCFQLNPRGEVGPRAIHLAGEPNFEACAEGFGTTSSQQYSTLILRRNRGLKDKEEDVHIVCPLVPMCSTFASTHEIFVGGEDGKLCMIDTKTGLPAVSYPQATFHQIAISFLRKVVCKFGKVYGLDGNGAIAVWDSTSKSLLSVCHHCQYYVHDVAPVPLAVDEASGDACKIPVFAGVMIRNYQESSASLSMSQTEESMPTAPDSGGKGRQDLAANCQSGYYFAVALLTTSSVKIAVGSLSLSLPVAWSAQTDEVSHLLRLQTISEDGEISIYENESEEQRFLWTSPSGVGKLSERKQCNDQEEEAKPQRISVADIHQGTERLTLSTASEDSNLVLVMLLDRTLENCPAAP